MYYEGYVVFSWIFVKTILYYNAPHWPMLCFPQPTVISYTTFNVLTPSITISHNLLDSNACIQLKINSISRVHRVIILMETQSLGVTSTIFQEGPKHSRACHYLTICRWRQSGTKAPRRLHEAIMVAPRATTEAPRKLHEAATKPSQPRRLHEGLVNAPLRRRGASILWIFRHHHGCFVEPSRSLPRVLTNSTSPRCNRSSPKGVFIVNPRSPRRNRVSFQFLGSG